MEDYGGTSISKLIFFKLPKVCTFFLQSCLECSYEKLPINFKWPNIPLLLVSCCWSMETFKIIISYQYQSKEVQNFLDQSNLKSFSVNILIFDVHFLKYRQFRRWTYLGLLSAPKFKAYKDRSPLNQDWWNWGGGVWMACFFPRKIYCGTRFQLKY